MRTSTLPNILAISLIIVVAALIGYISNTSSAWAFWVLCGAAAILLVIIFLLARSLVQAKKQAALLQEKLSATETRFQAFFNDPAVGIGILGLDRRLMDANPTFFRIFGRPREDMIGMNSAEVTYPDDDPASAKLFMELLKGERDLYEADRRYIRKDGKIFWAHVTMSIVRRADNTPDYLVGVLMDVDKQKRDALALQESQARFQAIFNSAAVGVGIVGLDRRVIDANPAICRMFGVTREDLIGMNPTESTFPEDDPSSIQLFNELASGQRDAYETDRRYIRKNGEIFWVHVTMSSVRGSDNKPLYLVGLLMDVDVQKRNALALEESEARFRAAFESSAIGMALTTIDGHFLKVNAAVRKMSGYTEEELQQLTSDEVVFSEDLRVGLDLFVEMMAGKRDYHQVERRYLRKNGEVFWTRLTLSAVHDAQGNIAYLVALVEDIDEQKRTLAELKKSEARFQALFDNLAVGIAVTTLDGKPTAFNPVLEKITGYTFDDIQQLDSRLLVVPEDWEKGSKLFEELMDGKRRSYTDELRYRRKNGDVSWARINYSLVRDANGNPDYLVIIIEDINEQRHASEILAAQEAEYLLTLQQRVRERTLELEEANQHLQKEIEQRTRIEKELADKAALEAVAADRTRLARDLHDAVTQTLFSSSLIAEVLPDLWEMDVNEAKRSTEELRQLTRGALAEMRTLLLELRPSTLTKTSLKELITQLCETSISRARLPIQLSIEGQRELPPEVQVAFYRIAQECLNNVFKYARATEVNVSLFMTERLVRFEVRDNGIGFELSASKPMNFGSRIMRERAESIGADLHISSAPGKGTCVEVTWEQNPDINS